MIKIIPARIDDAKVFYDVRYSPLSIQFSKTKTIPTYPEHLEWFEKNYQSGFYTILYDKTAVGYIRINKENIISIAVLPAYYNRGIARMSLKKIVKKYSNLIAEIYNDNIVSLNLFRKFPEIKLHIIER